MEKTITDVGITNFFTEQAVAYTPYDKVDTVRQGGNTLAVDYGIDRQRVVQTFTGGKETWTKRYFTPLYETVTVNGETKNLHYLTSATGIFAIFVTQNSGTGTMYYTLKDHQGSLAATIHGSTVERLSYDPWGRRRNTTNFGYDNVSHTFDRGYTLHEHYDEFDLINMNGRLYDPIIGRMLSPDIVVQDEQSSQAYNRYSYCFNNPLRFTDPSGYEARGLHNYLDWNTMTYLNLGDYRNNGSAFNTDLSEGFTLPLENIYTVDDDGNIMLVEPTNDNYDIIYTQYDWELGNTNNGLIVYDQSILSNLAQDQPEYNGDFATSNNRTDMFNLFYFLVNNSRVEWAIDGYRLSGHNEYVLRTSHSGNQVKQFGGLSKYNDLNRLFGMHSHPHQDGTKNNIHSWFKHDGHMTIFPKHYVFHKQSQVLYYYDPWKPNYYIRKVTQPSDLYRNLGF